MVPQINVRGSEAAGKRGASGAVVVGTIVLVLATSLRAAPGWGQQAGEGEDGRRASIELAFENDAFMYFIPGKAISDREYSNGAWIATERNDAPVWGRLFDGIPACSVAPEVDDRCLQTRLELGQKIYTPEIRTADALPDERPYAGWLYASADARRVSPRASRSLRLELGVTGPPSLGEEFQKLIHLATGFSEPLGWHHQLGFEPGIIARYEERRLLERRAADGAGLADMIISAAASAGNVRTGVHGSVTGRLGHNLPHPWMRSSTAARGTAVFGFLELRRQWLARDLFLDGSTFNESASVERIRTTGEWRLGAAVDYREVRIQFIFVSEGHQYVTQPREHEYGSLSLVFWP